MKITLPFHLLAIVPLFFLSTAASPPADVDMMHLRYHILPNPVPVAHVANLPTRFFVTNAMAYQAVFGTRRDVDFDHEWVFFYSAGLEPTTGYDARVLDIGYLPDTQTLVATTQLASPGPDCIVEQAITMPCTLVKFPRPDRRAHGAQFFANDVVVDCE